MSLRMYLQGEDETDELALKFRRFDQGTEQAVDDATENTVKEFRDSLTSRIKRRGLVSDHPQDAGDGPPLHRKESWPIEKNSYGRYYIRSIHDRAMHLEFGTRPYVAGDEDGIMRFRNQNGDVVFAGTPENPHPGVKAYGFWRGTIREFEAENRFESNLRREIRKLMEETF